MSRVIDISRNEKDLSDEKIFAVGCHKIDCNDDDYYDQCDQKKIAKCL